MVQIPAEELEISYARSSGPGGQNVNKVNSKAVVKWDFMNSEVLSLDAKARLVNIAANKINSEDLIVVSSDESRDQRKNLDLCLQKLSELADQAKHRPKVRKKTKPSKGAKAARLRDKKALGEKKSSRKKVDY
jgi:ribosome-associated protein